MEPANDLPRGNRDGKAEAEIRKRHFPAEKPTVSPSATSLAIGAEIRNEKVTPSGMPALTKPINRGTAEQEQKGVTVPSPAASTLPIPSRFPARSARLP